MSTTLRVLRGRALTYQLRYFALRSATPQLIQYRLATSIAAQAATASRPSFLRRAAKVFGYGLVITTISLVATVFNYAMASPFSLSTVEALANPPTDEETLTLYEPRTEDEHAVNDFITNHFVAKELRMKPDFTESRPHMKIPEAYRPYHLTGGLLMGGGRIVVPPLVFSEEGGKSMVAISYLGNELCGHPGIVHGGLLATMLDEGLARCCFPALPHKIGVTANLNINYRAPTKSNTYVVLRATTTKAEGRKAWVEGRIETLVGEGETPVVLAEATALFISPKEAAMIANVFPTQ